MEHKLVLTRKTDEFVEWECPTCDKHIRVAFAGGLKVLHPGDQTIIHSAVLAVPGLELDLNSDVVEGPDPSDKPIVH